MVGWYTELNKIIYIHRDNIRGVYFHQKSFPRLKIIYLSQKKVSIRVLLAEW